MFPERFFLPFVTLLASMTVLFSISMAGGTPAVLTIGAKYSLEDVFATIKSHRSQTRQVVSRNLPCGCVMQWDDEETTVAFCSRHTVDYIHWEGSDREFIKIIATPGEPERKALEFH